MSAPMKSATMAQPWFDYLRALKAEMAGTAYHAPVYGVKHLNRTPIEAAADAVRDRSRHLTLIRSR